MTIRNSWKLAMIIVLAGVGFFVLLLFLGKESRNESGNITDITPRQVERTLLVNASFDFSEIAESNRVMPEKLPSDLIFLILPGARDLSVESVSFKNQTGGYKIEFSQNKSLIDTNLELNQVIGNAGWQTINGRRARLFSFIEAENSNYEIRVSQFFIDDNKNSASILVIAK